MMDNDRSLRGVRTALLACRGHARSTGEPLHTYRFTRAEYEEIKQALAARRSATLGDWDGRALFVAFVAEWFRRDREGGKWEWIRPCAEIGIVYGGGGGSIPYGDIREAVVGGLAAWGRKAPSDDEFSHKWLMAVVRECGFPAADLQRGGKLHAWLAAALDMIERGYDAKQAVGMESWRATQQLVDATFDTAVELCRSLADMRARLRASGAGELGVDPIAYFDAADTNWRDRLPIMAEDRHARALIDDLVRAEEPPAALLSVTRLLRKQAGVWRSVARIALDGSCAHQLLPQALRPHRDGYTRLAIRPRGRLGDTHAGVIASLEREVDRDGEVEWRLSRRVASFEPPYALEDEVKLGAEADGLLVAEFAPEGGEPIPEGLAAFRIRDTIDPEAATEFSFLSTASARVRDPWLVLAGPRDLIARVSFDGASMPIDAADDALNIVAFSGRATLARTSSRYSWTTSCDEDDADDLVVDGVYARMLRESVFLGLPRIAVLRNGVRRTKAIEKLHWRALGRGSWQTGRRPPCGRIELAEIADGEIIARRSISCAPEAFALVAESGRRLRVSGVDGAALGASFVRNGARQPLPSEASGTDWLVDLYALSVGEVIDLDLTWGETRLQVSLRDPTTRTAFIGPDGRVHASGVRLSIGALAGWRAYAVETTALQVELPPRHGRRVVGATIPILGETPLVTFQDQIKSVLASSNDNAAADTSARVEWLGNAARVADIGWYDAATDQGAPMAWEAISLVRPKRRFRADTLPLLHAALAANGGGPFVIYSTRDDKTWSRPTFKAITPFDETNLSLLQRACAVEPTPPRQEAIAARLRSGPLEVAELEFVRQTIAAASGRAPFVSFDLLRTLSDLPDTAVACLAFADDLPQRACTLSLEDELPLIWGTTRLAAWRAAWDRRVDALAEKLALVDDNRALAVSTAARWLGEICNVRPAVSGHAFLVARHWWPARYSPARDAQLIGLGHRLDFVCARGGIRPAADALMRRQANVTWPDLNLAQHLGEEARHMDFAHFRVDVIAAPHVAAAIALERIEPTAEILRACRQARMFDPTYFDDVLPRAMVLRADNDVYFAEGLMR